MQPIYRNMVNVAISRLWLLLCLTLFAQLSFAMPDDRTRPAELSADLANFSQQQHRGYYQGNVKFSQGTTHLVASKAITKMDEHNKLMLAMAFGNSLKRAHFWTQLALDKPLLHAYADEIRYYPKRHLIKLLGHAQVIQGDNSIAGKHITYNTVEQHVVSKGERHKPVKIILHPKDKNE